MAYACDNGRFAVTLIIKEPGSVDIRLNGRLVKHLQFSAPQPSWHGEFPVTGHGGGPCTLDGRAIGASRHDRVHLRARLSPRRHG